MNQRIYFLDFIDDLGRRFLTTFRYTLELFMLVYLSVRSAVFNSTQSFRSISAVIFSQVYFTGWLALPLITILALASSGIVVLQSTSQFNFFGGGGMLGQLLVVIVIREIAPLLTALIVIARSGTAVATELGNMRVNQEIEALETLGINPLSYIVFPRIAGGIISVSCLAMYFILTSIIGGFIFSKIFLNMSLSFYLDAVVQVLSVEDLYLLAFKNIVGGAVIFTISCHQGLKMKTGPHEVPQSTTKAVVDSIIYVIAFNLIVTILFYINQLIKFGII